MLVVDCPTHHSRVLVPEAHIDALANTPAGIVVLVRCWCGTAVRLHTGRRRERQGSNL